MSCQLRRSTTRSGVEGPRLRRWGPGGKSGHAEQGWVYKGSDPGGLNGNFGQELKDEIGFDHLTLPRVRAVHDTRRQEGFPT